MRQQDLFYDTFRVFCDHVRTTAERIDRQQYALANAAAARAGLGTARNVWTNAQTSADAGRPWPEVDYAQLRQAEYHDRLRWIATDIADRIITRAIARFDGRVSDCPITEQPIISWERPYRRSRDRR